jgi:signal transduction histidine kinase
MDVSMPRARTRVLGLNIILAAAAAAVVVAIVYGAQVFSQRNSRAVGAAFEVGATKLKMSNVYTSLLLAESSQRGYLLTRDEAYLTPFLAIRGRIQADVAEAEQRFADLRPTEKGSSNRATPFDEIGAVAAQKFSEMDRTVDLTRTGKAEEALAIVRDNVGLGLMSRARDIVDAGQAELSVLRDERIADLRDSAGKLTMLTTLGVFAVIALSLLALVQMGLQARRLQRAREDLVSANDELEEKVRERTRDLQRANEEIQRYAYVVSHDLRAPLVNIVGFTRELASASQTIKSAFDSLTPDQRSAAATEAVRAIEQDVPEALRFIESSTGRMDNLINAILDLSRLGRLCLQPQEIDLNALVGDCIASIRHRADEAKASVAIEGRLPRLIGDRKALEQIFSNLLDNAVKYLTPDRPGRITIRHERRGAYAVVAVEDNGRGVAPADHERIFQLFRRAGRQDRPGEGIGLAHVQSLVRRMGGDIVIESDGISGSAFKIALPYDLRRTLARGERHATD